jgi:hypothetical protein
MATGLKPFRSHGSAICSRRAHPERSAWSACIFIGPLAILTPRLDGEDGMNEYQIGGGLRLLTAVEKTDAFGEFLKTRMVRALETEDPTELHYLLAQLDDYHSYMWRYYKKLAKDRAERMNPGV